MRNEPDIKYVEGLDTDSSALMLKKRIVSWVVLVN